MTICNCLALNPDPEIPPWMTGWDYNPTPEGIARNERGYAELTRVVQPILTEVNSHRERFGLSPIPAPTARLRGGESPLATISQQPAFFDFPRSSLPQTFHYTGPFLRSASSDDADFPFDRLDGRPLIYASMGTLQNRRQEIFQAIAGACDGLDAQLVVSLGRRGQPLPNDLPGQPLLVDYAPQRLLLERAALTITHAGVNTVLESLACGFPGVDHVYAVQAGREIRVIVDAEQVNDRQAAQMCNDIAAAIEKALTYPGEVKVTVQCESSSVEYAC